MSFKELRPLEKILYRAPEGFLLAGLTGLGYFAAYLSEIGYKSYFKIPSMFIEISINSVILAVCLLIFMLLIAYLSISMTGFQRYGKIIFALLIPAGVAVIIGMKLGFTFQGDRLWPYFLAFTAHALLLFLFFHFAQKRTRASTSTAVVLLLVLVVSVAVTSGHIIAKNQSYFLVSDGPNPLVVVDTYKDALIVAPFNPETGTIKPSYHFLHLESGMNEKLKFKMKAVGPLKVVP
ncbi:hypothetical protein [Salinithrix halophila]|uniref:Uncharacterized protein n=1 Tax=Salinithrix halophila TaxID=1485204 RepID=A0ABV8JEZ3_9BACL